MKPIKDFIKGIAILILLIISIPLNAQNSSMDFTLESESLYTAGQNVALSSTITKTGDLLVWIQHNNMTEISSFTITGSDGNWDTSTSTGSITFAMTIDEYPCELILSGSGTGLTMTLNITISGTQTDQYIFDISTIAYQ